MLRKQCVYFLLYAHDFLLSYITSVLDSYFKIICLVRPVLKREISYLSVVFRLPAMQYLYVELSLALKGLMTYVGAAS